MARNANTDTVQFSESEATEQEVTLLDTATLTLEQLREQLLESVETVAATKRGQLAGRFIALHGYIAGLTKEDNADLFSKSSGKLVMERVYGEILSKEFKATLDAAAFSKSADSLSRATLDRYHKGTQLLLEYGLPVSDDTATGAYRATESATAMKLLRGALDGLKESGKLAVESFDTASQDAAKSATARADAAKEEAAEKKLREKLAAEAESEAGDADDAPNISLEVFRSIVQGALDRLAVEDIPEARKVLTAYVGSYEREEAPAEA